jgi:hypothetical protein
MKKQKEKEMANPENVDKVNQRIVEILRNVSDTELVDVLRAEESLITRAATQHNYNNNQNRKPGEIEA